MTDGPKLVILVDLAAVVGFQESIVLQQLHYWTRKSSDEDGWVYNTLAEWREQFPFWSVDTIKRIFASLRDQGLVEKAQRRGSDRVNSYRMNYAVLEQVGGRQFAPINRAACTLEEGILPPSSNTKQKTTQKKTSISKKQLAEEWDDWLADFIAVTGRTATRGSKEARRLFSGRRNGGRTVEELKEATRGCHGDDFCRERKFDRPETILLDGKVTRYIELHRNRGGSSNGAVGDPTLAKMAARDD